MTKIRATLVAAALTLTVTGSAGLASTSQAATTDNVAAVVKTSARGGDGWCC